MKPLFNCPYCGCYLKKVKLNENWYEASCPDQCTMKYRQYYPGTFDSDELSYVQFYTTHFSVYLYFAKGFFPNLVHFYSHREIEEKGTAKPIIDFLPVTKIPFQELETIDTTNDHFRTKEWLKEVDDKLYTLTLLS